jgi:hypothetical protein
MASSSSRHDSTDSNVADVAESQTGPVESMSAASLQETIDQAVHDYKKADWESSLHFEGHFCYSDSELFCQSKAERKNLFQYTSNLYTTCQGTPPRVVRFDPSKYSPAGGWNGEGALILITALELESKINGGCQLISNGCTDRDKKSRKLCCERGKVSRARTTATNKSAPHRKTTFQNNRKNTRGEGGKCAVKRTSTKQPESAVHNCDVSLVYLFDDNSFFMICGKGNAIHKGHPSYANGELLHRKRFLDKENEQNIKAMSVANAPPALTSKM